MPQMPGSNTMHCNPLLATRITNTSPFKSSHHFYTKTIHFVLEIPVHSTHHACLSANACHMLIGFKVETFLLTLEKTPLSHYKQQSHGIAHSMIPVRMTSVDMFPTVHLTCTYYTQTRISLSIVMRKRLEPR